MKKTAAYIIAVVGVLLFAILYFRQRSLLSGNPQGSKGLMVSYLCLLLFSGLFLVVLCFFDLKRVLSSRVEQWMVESRPSTEPSPELEEAQRVRSSGDPLEAIRLLREYLQANPYELHVMSRIAEIYRYDLNNDLAAALEYEELLKRKLPDDQWAWAALHLAKLYGRLNQLDKSVELLERLDNDYGHTIAGRRAKKALQSVRDPDGKGLDSDDSEQEGATS